MRRKAGSKLPTPTVPTSQEVEAYKQKVHALAAKFAAKMGVETEEIVSSEPAVIGSEGELRLLALSHQFAVKARRQHARQQQRTALRSIPRRVIRSIPRARVASPSRRPVASRASSSRTVVGAAMSSSRGDPSSSSDDPEPQAPDSRHWLEDLEPQDGLEQVGRIVRREFLAVVERAGGAR
jgi:hypothetical protein